MSALLLTEYINNGLILHNLEGKELFDVIIYDSFINEHLEHNEKDKLISLDTIPGSGIAGKLVGLANKYRSMLIVLTQTPVSSIVPFLQEHKHAHCCIIHTYHPDQQRDLSMIQGLASIIEPIDFTSLFAALQQAQTTSTKYIRLQPGEYPNSFVDGYDPTSPGNLYPCMSHGIAGPQGTVITGGRATNEVVYALTKIQEAGGGYDCFIANGLRSITDELRDSLLQTELLIIVTDGNETFLKQYAQSKLFEHGLFSVEVRMIYPDYSTRKTLHHEYLYQEAGFSIEQFVEHFSRQELH